VRERRSLKAGLQRQGDAHARRVRYETAGELPRRVAIPPAGVVGDCPYPRECWEYLRGTIAALPIELEVDAALGAVCAGAFLLRVDGREVVFDYSDYLLVDGAQQRYAHWLRFHHTAGFVPHGNIGSFPPISFLDWTEYERLSAELHYDAAGDAVLHMQAFEFLADSPSVRDRDLYARRKCVRDALVAAYDGEVFAELESQEAFWRRAAVSLVSVHVPGSWRHSLDRGQHQLIGLGVCTLSPEIWTATLEERIEPAVHYVRVRDDFSDLVERVEWCREHRSECAAIGRRAREFFREHSTPRAIWGSVRRRLRRG
jgi:hypothetical protein